jgi:hypothetical protein
VQVETLKTKNRSVGRSLRLFALSASIAVSLVAAYFLGVYATEARARRHRHLETNGLGMIWREVSNAWPRDAVLSEKKSPSTAAQVADEQPRT